MSLQIRMARAAMESEYADFGDQGDPGLGNIIRGAGRFFGKAGKLFGKVVPFAAPAAAVAAAGLQLLRKKPKLLGPGLPTSQFPMPVLFGDDQGPLGLQASTPAFPVLPGGGFQLPRGRVGGVGIDLGSFQRPPPQQFPVGRPGQPTGQQVCGDGQVRNTRLNKSGYFTYQQGRAPKPIQWVAPGTKCVATRKMNPLNPRALSRAVGRVMSAKRASKLINRVSVRSSCPTRGRARKSAGSCKKR